MKKAFKLFAMALVASAMVFACGEKDPEGDNNNPNDNNNPGGEPAPEKIEVTFGPQSWTAQSAEAYYFQGGPYIFAFSDATGEQFPIMALYTTSAAAGNYSDSFDGDQMMYNNGNINTLDYYEEYSLSASGGNGTYGDWWAKTATVKVNSFDATSLLFNAEVTAVMFSALEAYVADFGAVGMDAASTKDMTAKINFTLTPYGKAIAPAAKTSKLVVK